jgi:hypothetical protein
MKTKALFIILVLGASATVFGDRQTINDIEGLWKLIEWHHEGAVLTPPQIGGRLSLTGGTILYIVFRQVEDDSLYNNGYGSYSIEGNEYRYGYEMSTRITVQGEDQEVWADSRPEARYLAEPNGTRLEILDPETRTKGLVLEGDRLTWVEESRPLRVYERVGR